ncbi:gibberellin 2-beta-dioxygenase-like [Prosopis cineraria]|uniref:gibberellin 2-beta-dioxygenase-like n=1 Tax=Prosopis cineraria TaxID=364024 RepID=UPI00240F92F4|nr:gibberellin 2-beta-dioxygenase-like [Prosopis cineraria]
MVALSRPPPSHNLFHFKSRNNPTTFFDGIPVVDLSHPDAKFFIVQASQEFGFFKLLNHGVPMEFITALENEAFAFFAKPKSHKDRAGPPDPFGYGSKRIGCNGDLGWIEYLLLNFNPDVISPNTLFVFNQYPPAFCSAVEKYVSAVRNLSYQVLELMADGLEIEERNAFSRLLRDEKSDSLFRLNHYPPCSGPEALSGKNLIGFGEHTDPQLISVLRSNNTSGLQICLRDGTWVSVPSDHTSFFINIGDTLQVMTNGRFKSVKHRVVTDSSRSRLSMIYFGGPPLIEKIAPLASLLMGEEEESLYKEFTWCEYKKALYKSRLGDNRLALFQKAAGQ